MGKDKKDSVVETTSDDEDACEEDRRHRRHHHNKKGLFQKVGGSLKNLVKGGRSRGRNCRSNSPQGRRQKKKTNHRTIDEEEEYDDDDDEDYDNDDESYTYDDFRQSIESANGYRRSQMGEIILGMEDSLFACDLETAVSKALAQAKKDKKHKKRLSDQLGLVEVYDFGIDDEY